MKKLTWSIGILFFIAAITACNEDIITDFNNDGFADVVDGYTIPELTTAPTATVYLPDAQSLEVCLNNPYNLTAGQHINAGSVEVVNDGNNLYVTYNTIGVFGTLHLWVGTSLLDVPAVPNGPNAGTPIPGHFPYSFDASGLQHYTFVIPLSEHNYICGTQLYFLAHAEVSGDLDGDGIDDGKVQTAFGGGTPVNVDEPGRWYFYDTYTVQCCTFKVDDPTIKRVETAYAKPPKTDGLNTGWVFVGKPSKTNKSNPENYYPLNLTQNRWGWVANVKTIGEYTFPVWAGAGLNNTANGTNVGSVRVNFDGSTVTVTYNLTGAVLEEVHVYAGDFALATIAPGQYGFTKYFETPFVQSTFSESFSVSDTNGDGVWVCLHAKVGIF